MAHDKKRIFGLALGALGVVYGDIGTSPLYAVKECFHGIHAIGLSQGNVYGVLSLIFWSLSIVVSLKYVAFIMRADNKGEGGIFALLAQLPKGPNPENPRLGISQRTRAAIFLAALFGAALLYGDGIITPAISVLSAVEGLSVATSAAEPLIIPLTCIILLGLFMVQKRGTATIGRVFGPIMIVWFAALALMGLRYIMVYPHVLAALNPVYAVRFFHQNGMHGFVVLASVVLCITGGEALYADMGHFGRGPIRLSWYGMVFPALLLNYFGQGALLLADPSSSFNPFYQLVPRYLLYPMVGLSTAATIIASQAMISGAFSLTQQAVQLGYCPRVRIKHTSSEEHGQIFIPEVNNALMIGCIGLVLAFRESSRLAAAYGIAVTATMGITSIIYFFVVTRRWRWPLWKALPLVVLFCVFDFTYLGANLMKVMDGGWFTITIGVAITLGMAAWKDGRAELASRLAAGKVPIDLFIGDVARKKPFRVPGAAVFMSISPEGAPVTLLHHFKHNKVLHEKVLLLTIKAWDTPYMERADRLQIEALGEGFFRVVAFYGFMERPNVPEIMQLVREKGMDIDPAETTFYLGRETLLPTGPSRMARWRKSLFIHLSRNAGTPTAYFNIPPSRVVELGSMLEL